MSYFLAIFQYRGIAVAEYTGTGVYMLIVLEEELEIGKMCQRINV